jgi:toxin ParE1/3/4
VRLHIILAVEQLQDLPSLGRPSRRQDTRQLIVTGLPYIIVYRVDCDQLVILGIFHTARER